MATCIREGIRYKRHTYKGESQTCERCGYTKTIGVDTQTIEAYREYRDGEAHGVADCLEQPLSVEDVASCLLD